MTLPTITATGNLGQEPDLSFTPSGAAVLAISVGCSKSKRLDDGTWETIATTWLRVKFWREEAERLAGLLTKGSKVTISGDLLVSQYDRKDGSGKGTSVDVENALIRIWPNRDGQATRQPAPAAQASNPWSTAPAQAAAPQGGNAWATQPSDSEPPF